MDNEENEFEAGLNRINNDIREAVLRNTMLLNMRFEGILIELREMPNFDEDWSAITQRLDYQDCVILKNALNYYLVNFYGEKENETQSCIQS